MRGVEEEEEEREVKQNPACKRQCSDHSPLCQQALNTAPSRYWFTAPKRDAPRESGFPHMEIPGFCGVSVRSITVMSVPVATRI